MKKRRLEVIDVPSIAEIRPTIGASVDLGCEGHARRERAWDSGALPLTP